MIETEALDQISPFNYLTQEEKLKLVAESQLMIFQDQAVICDPASVDYDCLYLLIQGYVTVIIADQVGYIYSPSYFGELAVFFDQPRQAKIVAGHDVSCIRMRGEDIRSLLKRNLSFNYAFSSSLRYKQQIFSAYQLFINSLYKKKELKAFTLNDILPLYKNLHPILHQGSANPAIDFPALQYSLSKLPSEITTSSLIVLAEYLPETYHHLLGTVITKSNKANRKHFYQILPGKILILLRDEITDYINIITNISIYLIEVNKIINKLNLSNAIGLLSDWYSKNQSKEEEKERLKKSLAFSPYEEEQFKKTFGNQWLKNLHEIVLQSGRINIEAMTPDIRYYTLSSELWIRQIKEALYHFWNPQILSEDVEFHIISSNTHSVLNCLSPWIQKKRDQILSWAQSEQLDVSSISEPADQLYAAAKKWLELYPEQLFFRDQENAQCGIYELADSSFTGIKVTLIDVAKLSSDIDPRLRTFFNNKKKKIIINLDYAYGKQGNMIIRSLILLINQKIASISIFGKAGAVVGHRGEILLPDTITLQENEEIYPIFNCDISDQDFAEIGWQKPNHRGGILTVLGTLMQSREMLLFYKLFFGIIGLEMEGSYYLQEIQWAKIRKLLKNSVALRFAYYISDTPLSADSNLLTKMAPKEGLPPTYAITRVMLKKILSS